MRATRSRWKAHPRSRGENRGQIRVTWKTTGSSPLTRGKRLNRSDHAGDAGLIPAHAGKTPTWSTPTVACWAHPRSRGENQPADTVHVRFNGSSPLTRGKPRARLAASSSRGLIPAHAGKTRSAPQPAGQPGAHPRSRGENGTTLGNAAASVGSSPLTRGKQCEIRHTQLLPGLIPAHAGKTYERKTGQPITRAHPRSRGENARSSRMFVA